MNPRLWDKVLVVQTSFLGDTVLTLPLLSEIRHRFPRAKISLLCSPQAKELLSEHPALDEIIVDDKKKADRGWLGIWHKAKVLKAKGFTIALCPHKSFRSGLLLFLARIPYRVGFRQSKSWFLFHVRVNRRDERHDVDRTLSILEGVGIPLEACRRKLDLPVTNQARQRAGERLGALGVDTSTMLIGFHPGSVWATKRWPGEGFARLMRLLKEKYPCEILLFGGPEDAECVANIQRLSGGCGVSLVDRITLRDLPAALGMCNVLVTNDSGPMHIAVARGVPVAAIFCATTPALGFYPFSSRAVVLEKSLSCRPCSAHGGRRCPLGTEDCMRLVQPERVLEAVGRLLEAPARQQTASPNSYVPEFLTL
jgi:heptosyltransferase II